MIPVSPVKVLPDIGSIHLGGEIVYFKYGRRYQAENAAVALTCLNEGRQRGWFEISEEALVQGLKQAVWAGRFEIMGHRPLVIIDGAHNVPGIEALCASVKELPHPQIIVFTALKDKETTGMAERLKQCCDQLIITQFDYFRAQTGKALTIEGSELIEDWKTAILSAKQRAQPGGDGGDHRFTVFHFGGSGMAEFRKLKRDRWTLWRWRFLFWLEIALLIIALIVLFAVELRIFPIYHRRSLFGGILLWLGCSTLIVPTLQRYRETYHRIGFEMELKRKLDQVEAVDPTGLDIDWNRQLGLDPAWMRCEWDWAYQGKVQSVPVQIGRFSLSKEGVKKPIVKNGLWIQLKGS